MMNRQQHNEQDYYAKIFNELSTLIFNIMRSPPSSIEFSDQTPVNQRRRTAEAPSLQQITPAGFASLLLGISLALMLCGSVTFFIGFFLMPWVIGLVMFLYFVAVVSSVSMIGKAILCHSYASTPRKDLPSWKLL